MHPTAVTVQALNPEFETRWEHYACSHAAGSPYHQLFMREVLRDVSGHRPHYRIAVDAVGRVCGVLPLVELRSRLFGHFLVSLPYVTYSGPLADSDEVATALMLDACGLAKDLGVSHAEFRDCQPRDGDWPRRSDKVNMQLSLPDSADALWRGFGSKLRAQIRRPIKAGAVAKIGGREFLDDFYAVYARNMRDLGMPAQPKSLFAAVLEGYPEVYIVVVYLAGTPAAAGFTLGGYGRLDIPWASSLREYNHHSVNMLLYWEALRLAIALGHDTFDFGRSSPDSGTYRFKRQWGAHPVPLYWHYWLRDGASMPSLSPESTKYQLMIAAWQRLPVSVTTFIGPRIIRALP